ncbi:Uu.00g108580.m01.CDS01 [Anthostomella pinea]|uniref:Uu.00g108580.m01.CDS01 n=1 Tax=Anthostomella pinea TaxID=933095 RepID=A0AAI8YG41_9PEZI|nr:Uu.00g108580.m01.CDS01 [Anthostomella pinea]
MQFSYSFIAAVVLLGPGVLAAPVAHGTRGLANGHAAPSPKVKNSHQGLKHVRREEYGLVTSKNTRAAETHKAPKVRKSGETPVNKRSSRGNSHLEKAAVSKASNGTDGSIATVDGASTTADNYDEYEGGEYDDDSADVEIDEILADILSPDCEYSYDNDCRTLSPSQNIYYNIYYPESFYDSDE